MKPASDIIRVLSYDATQRANRKTDYLLYDEQSLEGAADTAFSDVINRPRWPNKDKNISRISGIAITEVRRIWNFPLWKYN